VGAVDEPAQVVGRAVVVARREQVDAVVAPVVAAGELGDRHELERRDPDVGEVAQPLGRGAPRSLGRERAHMELVEHVALRGDPGPPCVGPRERRGIDDLRRPERPFGLVARRGVGVQRRVVAEPEAIARAGGDPRREPRVVAARLAAEHDVAGARRFDHQRHLRVGRCPHPDVDAALGGGELGADR